MDAGIAFVKWRAYYSMNGEEKAAVYLQDLLTELGPAFVKIGQAVSSRPDVVPPVYIRQLEFLQVHHLTTGQPESHPQSRTLMIVPCTEGGQHYQTNSATTAQAC